MTVRDRRLPVARAWPAAGAVAGRSARRVPRLLAVPAAVIALPRARRSCAKGDDEPVRVHRPARLWLAHRGRHRLDAADREARPSTADGAIVKQLIQGGRLLTAGRLDGGFADLLIDGDTIVAVLPPGESVTEDARRVDATNRLLIPGLVNAHTHATVASRARRWPTAGRSSCCSTPIPGPRAAAPLEYKYLSA